VAPFSMLVPIVGVLSSWALFGEVIDGVEALAGVAVVGGVLIGSLPLRLRRRQASPTAEPEPVGQP
jgi:O-acetylserine/cysteine efflux transporter